MNGKAVGIDLGTTNSVVSVLEGGEPTVIANAEGGRTTPSVVGFSRKGHLLVGDVAKRQAITNPDRTIKSVKRHMGTTWTVEIDGKTYRSQEISARILQKLKRDAEAYLGDTVNQAVITVPAYFDDAQRQATKEAGSIAGLEVLRIINEPTSAALAYGLDKEGADQTIIVFDLGGGTFDVSILEIGEGVFEVKATSGNTHLGGDDWDQRVVDWLVKSFKGDHGVDLSKDKMALQRLIEASEKAKIELSAVQETQINLPFVTATESGPLHLDYELTRAKFQELTADLVEACRGPFQQAIKDAGLKPSEIDHVIMVGGSTRMPAVQDLVQALTKKEPHKGVNPDEVVAVGAAVQAGVLKGEIKDILLLDVTPLSLGIETRGGIMTKLIERNSTIPDRRTEVFTTAEDMQSSVEIHVLQGEREMSAYNKTLGKFQLVDLPPAPRGVPQIEVTFDIDANGIVHVSAQDKATGKQQSMTISGQSALGRDEIQKMVRDAEAHADEDKRRREEAETRNQADTVVYQTEKLLRDNGDKINPDERGRLDGALKDVKDALGGTDSDRVPSAGEALMQVATTVAQRMYRDASSRTEPSSDLSTDDAGLRAAETVVEAMVVKAVRDTSDDPAHSASPSIALKESPLVFVCYARADQAPENWRRRVRSYLRSLERHGISIWDDGDINVGSRWRAEIGGVLEKAHAAVLLVGQEFLNSEFITRNELPALLEAAEKRGARLFPLVVNYCLYEDSEIGDLQAFNDARRPLESLSRHEQNEILVSLTQSIVSALLLRK